MSETIALWARRLTLIFLLGVPLLSPVFFWPSMALFYLLTGLGALSWLIYNLASQTVRLTISPLLLPLLALTGSAIAATGLNQPNQEIWFSQTLIYPLMLVYLLLTSTVINGAKEVKKLLPWLLGLATLLAGLGIAVNLELLSWKNITPLGSPLNLAGYLIMMLPAGLVLAWRSRSGPKKLVYFLLSGVIVAAIILTGYPLLPGQPNQAVLLPQLAGWSIAIDTLKTKFFFGAGPAGFLNQFSLLKPLSLNLTPEWNVGFSVSSNLYFQLLTTLGMAGLTAFIWLVLGLVKLNRRVAGTRITTTQLALLSSSFSGLILGLFLPFTPIHWITLVSLMSLAVAVHKTKEISPVKDMLFTLTTVTLVQPNELGPVVRPQLLRQVLPWLIAIPAVIGLSLGGWLGGKIYRAELVWQQSVAAAARNEGTNTYNLQIKAIGLAPAVDRYHLGYSNTNLALANSLAANSQLSDQEKQTVSSLIQQAIREARTATQINPNKASNWANLANIYRNLVNFADGADQFAQAAYIKAIQLDPANAQLRVELGGLFYTLNKYDLAADRFNEAVSLKPNFANGYYNLSYSYQQQKKWLEAYQAMQQVANLTPQDSADWAKVQNELTQLKDKLPQKTEEPKPAAPTQQLAPPSPAPSAPADLPQISL